MNFIAKENSTKRSAKNAVYGRIGSLETRLANSQSEIEQAIKLRQKIFKNAGEFNADQFDQFCDHLIVVDNDLAPDANIVATYRLLNDQQATSANGFCSQQEFDLAPLITKEQKLLEFGRSCVSPDHRNKRTIELLWAGSWAHVVEHSIQVMFGCASFEGTDPQVHAEALSFLHHFAGADDAWNTRPVAKRACSYDLIEKENLDLKKAMKSLPTIIKGYLRLGAMFSTKAVIDTEFKTTDVLVILPIDRLNPKYVKYYGADASRHSNG